MNNRLYLKILLSIYLSCIDAWFDNHRDSSLLQYSVTSSNDCKDHLITSIDRYAESDISWGDAMYFLYSYDEINEITTLMGTGTKTSMGTDTEMWCIAPGHYIVYLGESSITDIYSYSIKICGTTPVDAGSFIVFRISSDGDCNVVLGNKLIGAGNSQSYSTNKFDLSSVSDFSYDYNSASFSMDFSDIDFSSTFSGDFSFSNDFSLSGDFSMSDFSGSIGITASPTIFPSVSPTVEPSSSPTSSPTVEPSSSPTSSPTVEPSSSPTSSPTVEPSSSPTSSPTFAPSDSPTVSPTIPGETNSPTQMPTRSPTTEPTSSPTFIPTSNPTSIYDTLEPSNRTSTCYSDCSYPGMTVDPADWGSTEYCQFYASTACTEDTVGAYACVPDCLNDCSDVFCDSMSTLVYACDPDSSATYSNKTVLETECLDAYAEGAETETLLEFDSESTFDDVSAAEMRNSTEAQNAALSAMSLAMSGVPVSQITIKDIKDEESNRRLFRRFLQTSGAIVTFGIVAKLEQLGYKSTEGAAAYTSLTNQISQSVSSGAFQQNLKAAGQTAGVTTFQNAKVNKSPVYTDPVVVAVVTVKPTSFPTPAPSVVPTPVPTNVPKKNSDNDDIALSESEISGVVVGSVIGFCLLLGVVYLCWDKKRLGDMEEQFRQHNFLTRMRSRSAGSQQLRSEGPTVASFDSIDKAYKSRDDHQGMDIEMEAKRQSDLEERRISEVGGDDDVRAAIKARGSDV